MVKDIEKLLAEGATPESIYQEALRVVEAKNAAVKRREQEKNSKREAAVNAMIEYVELITGEKATDSMKKDLDKTLSEFEEMIKGFMNVKTTLTGKGSSDEDKLNAFLKSIGAM